jgi:hypothetical protein
MLITCREHNDDDESESRSLVHGASLGAVSVSMRSEKMLLL